MSTNPTTTLSLAHGLSSSDTHSLSLSREPALPLAALTREFRIRLTGEFDVTGAASITATLGELADVEPTAGADLIVVDLSSVTFMDSRGLTALCDSRDLLEARGWHVYLIRAPRNLSLLLDHAISAGWLAPGALAFTTSGINPRDSQMLGQVGND